jgi:phosphoglycerate dehydrogenase-like enzyme
METIQQRVAIEVLMYAPAYARVRAPLERAGLAVAPILIQQDGSVWRDGRAVDAASAAPVAAWISSDLYDGGPLREFMIGCLKSPSLRWAQSSAAGYEHPVFAKLVGNGVALSTSDASAIGIAEFVIAAVFDAFHSQQRRRVLQSERRWARTEFREVHGTRWMIVGMGHVGREVALRARALGAEIIGVRRNPRGDEPADRMLSARDRGDVLGVLPGCDVIVLSAAANRESTHLVDAAFLAQLSSGTTLINIARGALIDELALLESLAQGRPALAILDVFEQEPLPPASPLWAHPNVRVSAHSSAVSNGFNPRNDALFVANLARFARGEQPHHLVDPELVRS